MAEFRTCPDTGFKIDLAADKLIKWNAVTAVIFLMIGGFFGLLVALTRWPAVHLLPAETFYLVLTAHGFDILLVWILFFEVALLYFTSTILLNARMVAPRLGWVQYILMLLGAIITNVAVLQGDSTVMYTSYLPMQAAPHFYLGIIIFAVGALIGCGLFFASLLTAKKEKTFKGSMPLVTFGAMVAAIIAVYTITSGALILIPTFLWSLGIIPHMDSLMYKLVWWAMGHSSQQVNVVVHIACWYAISAILFGAKPLSEKVSRVAFLMYILFLQLAAAHHLLVDPGISSEFKVFNTSYALYMAVLGSMIHGLTVPGSIEAAQRKRGYNKSLFEWLSKAPWGNPVFSGMILSLFIFGFLGGITGVVLGTEQLNLIMHNTLYVPGHFHATVAGGTTLAFMAMAYWMVPTLWQRELVGARIAKFSPYLFGLGMAMVSLFQMGAGTLGIPRRHWDISFADAIIGWDFPPAAYLMMGLNGIAAIVATVGGVIFILNMVLTVSIGKPKKATVLPADRISALQGTGSAAEGISVPGTLFLVLIFLSAFVLYYFVNWKFLSGVWPLS